MTNFWTLIAAAAGIAATIGLFEYKKAQLPPPTSLVPVHLMQSD